MSGMTFKCDKYRFEGQGEKCLLKRRGAKNAKFKSCTVNGPDPRPIKVFSGD